jgi:hypothetical protein
LRDEDLRVKIGTAARARAEQEFNRDKVVARYVDAYQRLVSA